MIEFMKEEEPGQGRLFFFAPFWRRPEAREVPPFNRKECTRGNAGQRGWYARPPGVCERGTRGKRAGNVGSARVARVHPLKERGSRGRV